MPDEQNDGADGRMLTVADDDRRARGQCRHPHHLEEASPLAQMDTPTKSTRVHGSSCATVLLLRYKIRLYYCNTLSG